MASRLYSFLSPIVRGVRTSPLVIRMIWKIRLPARIRPHWDTVTLVMKNVLKKKQGLKGLVLELGIGEASLNSLYYSTLTGNQVHGIDISDSRVASSSAVAEFNKLPVQFWKSDLFDQVKETYAIIFFNPPYVPTAIGEKLKLSKALTLDGDQVWDGGSDGMKIINDFLKNLGKHLAASGIALVGVQDNYITAAMIEKVAIQNSLIVKQVHTNWFVNFFIPTTIYELVKK